jgi:hypothetical protein
MTTADENLGLDDEELKRPMLPLGWLVQWLWNWWLKASR